jgi:predicted tellurium resistance membrane protein TerC
LFSSTVYANAAGMVDRGETSLARKFINAGNVISEYMGIYLFVISIPLVISAVTTDSFLRLSTGVIAVLCIMLYTFSDFSMLNLHIKQSTKYLCSAWIALIGASLILSQLYIVDYFVLFATIYLLSSLSFTAYYYKKA